MTATVGKDFHGSCSGLLGKVLDFDILHREDGVTVVNDLGRDFSVDRDAFTKDSVAAFAVSFASLGIALANRSEMAFLLTFGTCSVLCLA